MNWKKAIMKVNLAAQTFRTSVADALDFLNQGLNVKEFRNVEATTYFIRLIDGLFDLYNSGNPFGRGYKTPLRKANENYWKPFILTAIEYLSKCKNMNGKLLWKTKKRTPFIGFVVASYSFLKMYEEEVLSKQTLQYILTYKFSQDHLELFFCSVRSRNGWINNPNASQFIKTYKRLLLHHDIKDINGNCIAQDQTNILIVTSTKKRLEITDIHLNRKNAEINKISEEIQLSLPLELNKIAKNVISYISGYVIRMIQRQLHCPICLDHEEPKDDNSLKLINRKSRGGLLLPSRSSQEVCYKTEKKIQLVYKLYNNTLPNKDVFISLLLRDVTEYVSNTNYFKKLEVHVFDVPSEETMHKKKLIDLIITDYAKIRLNSLAKITNENLTGDNVRK